MEKASSLWQRIRGLFQKSQKRNSASEPTERTRPRSQAPSFSFGKVREFAQEADPQRLVEGLSDPQDGPMTALILGEMGERAVPDILKALDKPHLRNNAVEALGNIGSETALPDLLALVEATDSEPQLMARTLWALGEIGKAEAAVPIRKAIESAYYRYSPRASGSAQTREVFFDIRRRGVEALGKLEPFQDQDALEFMIGAALDIEDHELPKVGKNALISQARGGNEKVRSLTEEFSSNPDTHVAKTFQEVKRRI